MTLRILCMHAQILLHGLQPRYVRHGGHVILTGGAIQTLASIRTAIRMMGQLLAGLGLSLYLLAPRNAAAQAFGRSVQEASVAKPVVEILTDDPVLLEKAQPVPLVDGFLVEAAKVPPGMPGSDASEFEPPPLRTDEGVQEALSQPTEQISVNPPLPMADGGQLPPANNTGLIDTENGHLASQNQQEVLAQPPDNSDGSQVDSDFPDPYWVSESQLSIKATLDRSATIDIDTLIWEALAHSPYVQSILTRPQILETEIDQAIGVFDPTRFASSIWNDRSDPVGNTLTTGGPDRLNEQLIDSKAGVRKRNELGGNWEAAQELGLRDNNSVFFVPRKQADSRMVLRYTQPLMKGAGRTYNRASIRIAELNFDASNHEANRELQTHVLDIIQTYWELAYKRALAIQLHRGMTRIQTIADQLQNRADLDAIKNQILRARAAVSSLKASYARAVADIVQAEERLRHLVNAPWMHPSSVDEIIPTTRPLSSLVTSNLENELDSALMSRPEVLEVRDQIRAASIRLRVAQEDLRPTLNLITDFYVRGLNGNYDVANSLGDQFSSGAPSYSGGLEYLRPKNQRVAEAIRRTRDKEHQQLLFQLEDRLLQIGAEVRTNASAVQATHAELSGSVQESLSTQAEVDYLDARWQTGTFLEPTEISVSLEQLLDSEQRLIRAEGNWAASQAQYMIALAKLRFATGQLLSMEPLVNSETEQ